VFRVHEWSRRAVFGFGHRREVNARLGLRWIALAAVVGLVLMFFVVFRVSLGSGPLVSFRQQEKYRATETILVTYRVSSVPHGPPEAVPSLIAQLANSEPVRAMVRKAGPLRGSYQAEQVVDLTNAQRLPFIQIGGTATSPRQARTIARRASAALIAYYTREQLTASTPQSQQLVLRVVSVPKQAVLVQGRNLTLPIVAFGLLMLLLALAAVSESLDRRTPASLSH
jgi:hypothetical protein